MQVTDKIKERFGSWLPMFEPFITTPEFDKIFSFLQHQKSIKRVIVPTSDDVFKSFELCHRDNIKAIVILMDPYPSITKDNIVIANGVPMSCANTGALQPTLEIFYQGIEDSFFGFSPDFDKRADNSYLLIEEGVLLLNSSLTCEKDKPGSHAEAWHPFMKFFIEGILNEYYRGLPIVLCGAQAHKLEKYISPLLHYVKKVEHPVAASYQNRAWRYDDCFKWCNSIISGNNGPEHVITWYRKKENNEVQKCEKQKPIPGTKEPLKSSRSLGLPWDD